MDKAETAARSADFHARLPCEPTSVPQARARLRDWCHDMRMPADLVVNVGLAVTEAAANAVRHSGCDHFEVRGWTTDASLIVCVWDQGRGRRDPDPGAGLGIRIVRALAASVDFEDTHPGTRVTMHFSGTRASESESG